jgi:putative modified peptide
MESKNIQDLIAKLAGNSDFRASFQDSPNEALEDCGIAFSSDEKKKILDYVGKICVERLEERISALPGIGGGVPSC